MAIKVTSFHGEMGRNALQNILQKINNTKKEKVKDATDRTQL